MLKVTYRMMVCKRTMEISEPLSNIQECEVLPIRTQYGIVGYVLDIKFKNGAKKVQLYKDRGDEVQKEFEELSVILTGTNAKNNEEVSDCSCGAGGCYCICCNHWILILVIIILVALIYIGASFAIAFARDETIFE